MKSKFLRLISSLLILSFLVAAFSVFSFAEENTDDSESEGENTDNLFVFLNRDYEEGWDYNNGFSTNSLGNNKVYIDHDEDVLGRYNYFIRYQAASSSQVYSRLNFGTEAVTHASKATVGASIIEFSIKADDVAKLGNIVWMTTSVGRDTVKLLDINADQELVAFNGVGGGSLNLGKLENEWVNIAYIFDWTAEDLACTVKIGHGLGNGYSESYDLTMSYVDPGDVGIYYLFFGFPAYGSRADKVAANSLGMSFCLDNVKVYQGVKNIIELDENDYGFTVNTLAEKVIDIQESAGVKSKAQLLEEALAMKVGVDYALLRNTRYSLVNNADRDNYTGAYGAPVKQGKNVLIPLQLLLDYIGFPSYIHPDNVSFDITTGSSTTYITLGRDTATVDGTRVDLSLAPGYLKNSEGKDYLAIALEDVPVLFPGWLAIYDDMGLIIIYEDTTPEDLSDNAPIVNRDEDLSTMVDIMKKFIFDTTPNRDADVGYVENGTNIYNDAKNNTNNFQHPYIIADAETFGKLADAFALSVGDYGYDANLKSYIGAIVEKAEAFYDENADVVAGSYIGIKEDKAPVSTYTGDGYNEKGEMTELVEAASILPTLAFAYQMTGDAKFAKLAYDWSFTIAGWTHWGPGYITHCAEVTSYFAISYDWLYNGYKALGLDTDILAGAIYKNGVHDGYVSSAGKVCEHARALGDLSSYVRKTDSTNAVASSGMMIGALAILGYVDDDSASSAYSETIYLLGNNLQNLIQYGLDIYAPDGSYIESATYWEYATSNLFRMVMAINSAAGDDYGLMKTWGLDKTCYYAIHIEDSDGFIWNYHDGGVDGITDNYYYPEELAKLNTDMFNFVGTMLGDANLLAVRDYQIKNGKEATIYDLLFYPFDGISKAPELELNYHMEAVEGYVSRSDWSAGAMYTGIMGGMNNVNHGHIDSGNFIYRNLGISWIVDLGTENPYIQDYNVAGTRYKYYRVTGEGQNVVIMTNRSNIAYGQYTAAGGSIYKTFENEYGNYALLDNSSVYLSTVSYARRGVLVTNDRKTVVLQDEISFVEVQSLAWVIHTAANVTILDGGRIAYLEQKDATGKTRMIRATIVSQRPDFVFTQKSVNTPILTGTLTSGKITGEPEYSRNGITRLAIESTTISFDVAVVFEYIEDVTSMPTVAYKWTPMNTWNPSETSEEEGGKVEAEKRPAAVKMDIMTYTSSAENILKKKNAYTERLDDLYEALTTVAYTLKTFNPNKLESALANSYADYLDCSDLYNEYRDFINGNSDVIRTMTLAFTGVEAAEDL